MDPIADFQKSISEPLVSFAVNNPVLLLGILGLLVIGYFVSGVHTSIVLPLFDNGDRTDGNAGDGSDGGGDGGAGGGD